jgi:hypothetical protein
METTIQEVINHKKLSGDKLDKEWNKLMKYKSVEDKCSFVGNNIIYHYCLEHLIKCRRNKKKSLVEIFEDPKLKEQLWEQTERRNTGVQGRRGTVPNRMFECWRVNHGAIVFFKPYEAIKMYKRYGATKVLDPTAGWGGRALGAVNCGIEYTGIDTNIELKPAYDKMFEGRDNIKMIWESCLEVDFSKLDFDFVLTSPPYVNVEEYEHMTLWKNDDDFYKDFLIPLIDKCRKYCKGRVCFNISPQMYKKLMKYKYDEPIDSHVLKEHKNGNNTDMIYVW